MMTFSPNMHVARFEYPEDCIGQFMNGHQGLFSFPEPTRMGMLDVNYQPNVYDESPSGAADDTICKYLLFL
jgi:hypothetical protein